MLIFGPFAQIAKSKQDIPMEASGERYSHVFGTNATAFELFVVEKKIMGPCWLNLTDAKINTGNVSLPHSRSQLPLDSHMRLFTARSLDAN